MPTKHPTPGDWYLLQWCGLLEPFYVINSIPDAVCVVRPNWLSTSGHWMEMKEFKSRAPSYLGKGCRSFISYIPGIRIFFPRYAMPSQQK